MFFVHQVNKQSTTVGWHSWTQLCTSETRYHLTRFITMNSFKLPTEIHLFR